jgi:two-component system, chemotaxis family, protein-glutamate methylesterase/glutaminase
MMDNPIRVLVVDDTVTYRKIVSGLLANVAGVEVVGTAPNGKIALSKIEQLHPDLLTLDLAMPEMDGLEMLRRLKQSGSNVATIMLSALTTEGAQATMEALQLGAFDFVVKPSGGTLEENLMRLRDDIRPKIEAFARTRRIETGRHGVGSGPPASHVSSAESSVAQRLRRVVAATAPTGTPEVVALGISTGGPQALTRMLPMLPRDLPVPVLIVQHMPPVFTKSLADDLDRRCALRVCEATDGQTIQPGWIYIAPGGKQMRVERVDGDPVLRITDDPPENSCRPSVDHLFRSVAEVYGGNALGAIMTGMGNDGALGCRLLKRRGARILAQDEATCVVFGMPREPVQEGIADVVAPLDRIAAEITRLVGKGVVACR